MQVDEARAAEKADQVDVMAGKTPQSLRTPQYQTRVAAVEAAPSEPPTPPGSEIAPPDQPHATQEEEPAQAPQAKRAPPKKRSYRRRDTQAEST